MQYIRTDMAHRKLIDETGTGEKEISRILEMLKLDLENDLLDSESPRFVINDMSLTSGVMVMYSPIAVMTIIMTDEKDEWESLGRRVVCIFSEVSGVKEKLEKNTRDAIDRVKDSLPPIPTRLEAPIVSCECISLQKEGLRKARKSLAAIAGCAVAGSIAIPVAIYLTFGLPLLASLGAGVSLLVGIFSWASKDDIDDRREIIKHLEQISSNMTRQGEWHEFTMRYEWQTFMYKFMDGNILVTGNKTDPDNNEHIYRFTIGKGNEVITDSWTEFQDRSNRENINEDEFYFFIKRIINILGNSMDNDPQITKVSLLSSLEVITKKETLPFVVTKKAGVNSGKLVTIMKGVVRNHRSFFIDAEGEWWTPHDEVWELYRADGRESRI